MEQLRSILEKANQLLSALFSRGIPVILMGYSLGKAQILSYLFSSWDPIFVEESILTMNKAYIKCGIDIRCDLKSYCTAKEKGLLQKKPWILIAPMNSGRSKFISNLKKKFGAVTIAFSGWGVNPRYKYMMNVDHALPISDHCDFNDLISIVKQCNPHKVYTVHGFAKEFAEYLSNIGFDAQPLNSDQASLSKHIL